METGETDRVVGRASCRVLRREEVQILLRYADDQVRAALPYGRKAVLAAFRDGMVLKVMYAWGLRRREAVLLDVADWLPNLHAPELGAFGALRVRRGPAGPAQTTTRVVLSLFPWAVTEVERYLSVVRPLIGGPSGATMWPAARDGRLSTKDLSQLMAGYCAAAGLGTGFDPHTLRLSYIRHLLEDGVPQQLVRDQVGEADLVGFSAFED
ncbi:tyrosine-type recombinase/integrase [Phytohabitans sp. ZYX-F-186]|uniref:Tyrosine-type recombinase/integrase n=1 Tax=Phytohabitans maris TaxID=3071409 RepID=A0ABU0ZVH8_9ACTN|nr:tyrosine-type recombinase/integrase [Phytohabitans sp. ZYX-F-186]MDQ7910992.1 tyrosine-type recombinase/integrase [Phytohabitans sp. ZYX-F-186]